jgi:hypothetical protein
MEKKMTDDVDDYYMILKEMKQQEQNYLESVLIVTDNDVLRNGIISWQVLKCERIPSTHKAYQKKCVYDMSIDKWNWLWSQTTYSQKHLSAVADVKDQDINKLFVRMSSLRLIYPDGTIPNTVKGLLRNSLKSKFPQPKEKKTQSKDKVEEKVKKELEK